MIDLFQYLDCRAYLKDHYQERSARDAYFSHRWICTRLGQGKGSRSYFSNILAGRVRISPNLATRLVKLLELDKDQAEYFRLLVLFNQSDTAEERELYFDQIVRSANPGKALLDPDTYAYFRKWYNIVIREALDILSFKGETAEYVALAKTLVPNITPAQAREAVEFLEKAGLIGKDEQGRYKSLRKSITTGTQAESVIINQFQMACMDLAKDSLMRHPETDQLFSTLTMSISEGAYKRIEKRLQKLRSELAFLVEKDEAPSDRVYQFNFQLFPVTGVEKK
ncbi:MAG: TIGR02147 family protein [Fibrobacteria bacterium]